MAVPTLSRQATLRRPTAMPQPQITCETTKGVKDSTVRSGRDRREGTGWTDGKPSWG